MPLDALLLFADKRPQLVKLKSAGSHSDHDPVVQLSAATADAQGEGADRFPVDEAAN
jgi:hypothetical protein